MLRRQTDAYSTSFISAGLIKSSISPAELTTHAESINQAIVNRSAESGEVLMTTTAVHAIVKPGESLAITTRLNLQVDAVPNPLTNFDSTCVVSIGASWLDASIKAATVADDANIFGQSGLFLLAGSCDQLTIPMQNAAAVSADALAYFGATLVPINQPISNFNTSPYPLCFVSYRFMPNYIEQYVLQPKKGGGVFVETHDFPHVFVPMSPDCRGGLILGREVGQQQFEFSAFSIPYGYAMHIKSNVIHGDSFFVGEYAITLTERSKASTVLMRKSDESILPVEQVDASLSSSRFSHFNMMNQAASEQHKSVLTYRFL